MNVSEQDELLLNAYVDGELDPMEAVRFEQRLGAEPALSAQVEARRALRNALRSTIGRARMLLTQSCLPTFAH